MKTTTIVTAGTSIINNIARSFPELRSVFETGDYDRAAKICAALETQRLKQLSAELNSTISMIDSGIIDPVRMFLIASDTEDGRKVSALLTRVFAAAGGEYSFREIKVISVTGLNDADFRTFRTKGLRNFVTVICGILRQYTSGVAINNTGGYKAEIAFAGVIGQTFGVPVYYQHEKFGNMIELPPLPVTVDFSLWLDNLELFMELKNKNEIKVPAGFNNRNEKLHQLIDSEEIDGGLWISLSAAGHLFIQSCEYQMTRYGYNIGSVIPEDGTPRNQKEINLCGDHHGNNLLREFGRKICGSKYITKIVHSLPYEPRANEPVRRIICEHGKWYIDFVMTDTDLGYALRGECTARNEEEAKLIAAKVTSERL